MTAVTRRISLLLLCLALASPLHAQDNAHGRFRNQKASNFATRNRRLTLKKELDTRSSSFLTGELALGSGAGEVQHSALQNLLEASLLQDLAQAQSQRRLPILPANVRVVPLDLIPEPKKASKKVKGDRKMIKGESKKVKGSKTIKASKGLKGDGKGKGDASTGAKKVKGESKKISKGEPTPTKPTSSRPSKPTNRPMTPSAKTASPSPVSKPVVDASPFSVRYVVERRLSEVPEERHLQTTDDFFEASTVTIDYLIDYITAYFRKQGVLISGVEGTPSTFSADPLEIGYEITVTFKELKQNQNLVDSVITMALTTDGDMLVDDLQKNLPDKNPFSQTASIKFTQGNADTDGPTMEPTMSDTRGPTFDSTPPINAGSPTPTTTSSPSAFSSNVDSFGPSSLVDTFVPTATLPTSLDTITPTRRQRPTASPAPSSLAAPSTTMSPIDSSGPTPSTTSPAPSFNIFPTPSVGTAGPNVPTSSPGPTSNPTTSPTVTPTSNPTASPPTTSPTKPAV